jgi:hypothetical protein
MNEKENNVKERNKKEKLKSFWKNYKKNWIWVSIGFFIGNTFMQWLLFFLMIIDLILALFLTVFFPLIIILVYFSRKSKHHRIISKIMLIGCCGFVFGCIMWVIIGYVLIQASWAPLQGLPPVLRGRIFLLLLPTSCGIAAYIMYRIGKRRDWIFLTY